MQWKKRWHPRSTALRDPILGASNRPHGDASADPHVTGDDEAMLDGLKELFGIEETEAAARCTPLTEVLFTSTELFTLLGQADADALSRRIYPRAIPHRASEKSGNSRRSSTYAPST